MASDSLGLFLITNSEDICYQYYGLCYFNTFVSLLENNLVEKNFEVNNSRDYGTESNILVAHIDPSESLRVNSAVITLRTQC